MLIPTRIEHTHSQTSHQLGSMCFTNGFDYKWLEAMQKSKKSDKASLVEDSITVEEPVMKANLHTYMSSGQCELDLFFKYNEGLDILNVLKKFKPDVIVDEQLPGLGNFGSRERVYQRLRPQRQQNCISAREEIRSSNITGQTCSSFLLPRILPESMTMSTLVSESIFNSIQGKRTNVDATERLLLDVPIVSHEIKLDSFLTELTREILNQNHTLSELCESPEAAPILRGQQFNTLEDLMAQDMQLSEDDLTLPVTVLPRFASSKSLFEEGNMFKMIVSECLCNVLSDEHAELFLDWELMRRDRNVKNDFISCTLKQGNIGTLLSGCSRGYCLDKLLFWPEFLRNTLLDMILNIRKACQISILPEALNANGSSCVDELTSERIIGEIGIELVEPSTKRQNQRSNAANVHQREKNCGTIGESQSNDGNPNPKSQGQEPSSNRFYSTISDLSFFEDLRTDQKSRWKQNDYKKHSSVGKIIAPGNTVENLNEKVIVVPQSRLLQHVLRHINHDLQGAANCLKSFKIQIREQYFQP